MIAASESGHVKVVELLLTRGANIHDKDDDGWSPISLATWNGHVKVVELLLSKGANIHDKNSNGQSPIMLASLSGYVDMVDLLLSKGANIRDEDIDGYTCFRHARNIAYNNNPYRKHGLLYRLRKWPTTMAILVLTELALIYRIDSESLVDLHQYVGRKDFSSRDMSLESRSLADLLNQCLF